MGLPTGRRRPASVNRERQAELADIGPAGIVVDGEPLQPGVDSQKINAGVNVFVSIKTSHHNAGWLGRFADIVSKMPEVVEFYRMSGEIDYLLRVVVPDIAAYDAFYKRLIADIELDDVSSRFAMEQIKYTTALPLGYIAKS
jgi:Lrp/AsnC family transcriptional regulator